MNLNPNSFFFRYYLGYHREDLWSNPHPNTICDVIKRFLKRTLIYLLALHVIICNIAVTIAYGPYMMYAKSVEGTPIELFGIDSPFVNLIIGGPVIIGHALLTVALIAGVLFGIVIGLGTLIEKSDKIKKAAKNSGEVISAIHTRTFKKACVMVTVKDPTNKDAE